MRKKTLEFNTIKKGKVLKNKVDESILTVDKNPSSYITIPEIPSMDLVSQIKREADGTERKFKYFKAKQWKLAIRKRR